MALVPDRKLFLGVRLKRLRRELALTQSRMAEDLGVSPSYLNHLERNQRPMTSDLVHYSSSRSGRLPSYPRSKSGKRPIRTLLQFSPATRPLV